jgi:phage terminase large subunit
MFLYTMNPYTWDDPINLVLPDSRNDTRRITINHSDNPWFPEALETERLEAKATMSADEYLRIWEGIPFDNAENAVITRTQASAAMSRKVSTEGGTVTGADIARFGDDATVFVKRKGLQVVDMKIMYKKDTQTVASLLADFSEGGRIVIDDTGVGGGVTDRLVALGANVVPVNFGGKPSNKKKYPDIISEMWFNLADMIGTIGLQDDKELLAELSSRHYKYTADEKRKVESKEDYKSRTGRHSPDRGDAVILCYYNKPNVSMVF